jgi:hypothetical protein
VLAVFCAALLVLGASRASAQCGETTHVRPQRSLGPGAAPLAIGDSVLYDAAGPLAKYGFEIDAMVCRTMAQGIAVLQAHGPHLPVLVVVALGTNGSVSEEQINQLLAIVGPERLLALVTPHHGDYAYVPGLFRAAGRAHPGRIVVLDWDRLSADHPDWFAPDGIHLGGSAGIEAYARLVASSLQATPTPTSRSTTTTTTTSTTTARSTSTSTPPPPSRTRSAPTRPVAISPPASARKPDLLAIATFVGRAVAAAARSVTAL